MQANEFVKKFGWDKAKEFSQITIKGLKQDFCFEINTGESVGLAYVNLNDLKRLVESWEFVEEHGGFEQCKRWHKESPFKRDKYIRELKQAIADVESCHES